MEDIKATLSTTSYLHGDQNFGKRIRDHIRALDEQSAALERFISLNYEVESMTVNEAIEKKILIPPLGIQE